MSARLPPFLRAPANHNRPRAPGTPICKACHISGDEPGVKISKCSKCFVDEYCSKECQAWMWKAFHKHECRTKEVAGSVTQRATVRMKKPSPKDSPESEADAIYYVRFSRPYINDISINGPFDDLDEVLPDLPRNLRFSQAGLRYLAEWYRSGTKLDEILQIKAPLDADASKFVVIDIITEHNAAVKAVLPCPTYHVTSTAMLEVARKNKLGVPTFKSIESVGTFLKLDAAREAAKAEVKRLAEEIPGSKPVYEVIAGQFMGGLMINDIMSHKVSIEHEMGHGALAFT